MTDAVEMRIAIPFLEKLRKLLSTKFGLRLILLWPFSDPNQQGVTNAHEIAGQPEEAIRSFARTIRLIPFDPSLFSAFTGMGAAFGLGRFDEAVAAALQLPWLI